MQTCRARERERARVAVGGDVRVSTECTNTCAQCVNENKVFVNFGSRWLRNALLLFWHPFKILSVGNTSLLAVNTNVSLSPSPPPLILAHKWRTCLVFALHDTIYLCVTEMQETGRMFQVEVVNEEKDIFFFYYCFIVTPRPRKTGSKGTDWIATIWIRNRLQYYCTLV